MTDKDDTYHSIYHNPRYISKRMKAYGITKTEAKIEPPPDKCLHCGKTIKKDYVIDYGDYYDDEAERYEGYCGMECWGKAYEKLLSKYSELE